MDFWSSDSSPVRSAIPISPSPLASTQPTGPAYLPRFISSNSFITALAASVGVPQTAAEGWSEEIKAKISTGFAESLTTPVTSVARCITFARWRTNGDSGTFVDEQNGAKASATERTAYSCSSKSFEDLASDAASPRSFASSPDFRIVPAKIREVTSDLFRRTNSSGVAPIKLATIKTQVEG